ncbi:MAG TPA: hypothetical protein VEH10_04240 [Thermoplasmata archaeon]|nr:hypothetical protein [Thermoplasmata archaeon]
MSARRRHVELSVERPLGARGPADATARLSATFEPSTDGEGPSTAELSRALDELVRDLDGLLGPSIAVAPAVRSDRSLEELFQTYRPRQRELVDLLLADGEITSGEHASLLASLGTRPSPAESTPPPPGPDVTGVGETPIAAVPIAAEPKLPPARPVPELLRTFQIASLRQAGAVRARRQISFAEYMALKRHFEAAGPAEGSKGPARPGPSG